MRGVTVTAGGETVNLKTNASGYYSYWFDAAASPLSIAVSAVDHQAGSASSDVIGGGQTTTQDFSLRWLKPCSSTDPTSFNVNVALGGALDKPLTLMNNGAAATDWELVAVGVANVAQPITTPPVPGQSHGGATLMATQGPGRAEHGQVDGVHAERPDQPGG